MKIVHISLCGPVTDNMSYQDNILPKYHKKLGYEVSMITSKYIWNSDGEIALDSRNEYYNEYGIKTIRLKNIYKTNLNSKFKKYENYYDVIKKEKPNILFIHGVQFLDIRIIVQYLKNFPDVEVFVDNHADFSNSATNWISKNILHKLIWKKCAWLIEPYTNKYYGVLPARVDFLKEIYKLPEEKIELLVMGADDEIIEKTINSNAREVIRSKYNIKETDFLIVTGGKIDNSKKQVLMLMQAIKEIPDTKIKVIVFGPVIPELEKQVQDLTDNNKVRYIGWINAEDSYSYFAAADIVVFPGRHSVFWEQVTGQGIPMIIKYWDGTTHVDLGGNVMYLTKDSVFEIRKIITDIYNHPVKLVKMKLIAKDKGKQFFSYAKIAERSIL